MSGSISFGGLISGLDTKKIVDQLVNLRKTRMVDPVQKKIDGIADRKERFTTLSQSFLTLRTAAFTLSNPDNAAWDTKTSSSSNTSTALIASTDSSEAIAGTYDITAVTALARPDRVLFAGVDDKDTTLLGSGTINIKYGSNAAVTVNVSSGFSTLENIKDSINAADLGVTAAIINDGSATPYRLVLTGDDTGANNTVKSSATNYPALTGTLATALTVDTVTSDLAANQAADAAFTLNGLSITSSSNTVTESVPGVTFTLVATSASTTTVTVKQDTTTLVSNITKFIDEYNKLRKALKTEIEPDANGVLGPLASDPLLTSTSVNLSSSFSTIFNSLPGSDYTSLAQIGITTNSESNPTIDTGILTTALEDSIDDVRALFQGSTLQDGIAEQMYDSMTTIMQADGTLDRLNSGWTSSTTQLKTLLKERQTLVDNYKLRLQAKFNHMEQQISALKAREGRIDALAAAFSSGN